MIKMILLKQINQKKSKNVPVLLENRPFKTIIYSKSNGKPKLPRSLSRNYDFVFTNLLKNEAVVYITPWFHYPYFIITVK